MQIAISASLAIVFFLCLYLGFRTGLRLGMQSAKGIAPPPIKTPAQAVEDWWKGKEDKKENKEFKDGIDSMWDYNGDIPKGSK